MDINLFELLLSTLVGVLGAIVGVLWNRADYAAKTAEANKATLEIISKNVDKTQQLTERLSSLEASFNVEIKNLSVSIKRMESAVLRLDQRGRTRP